MAPEDQIAGDADARGGGLTLQPAGAPGLFWIAGWAALITIVFPAALITTPPIAVIFMVIVKLGEKAGIWPNAHRADLEMAGFIACLAIGMATVQGVMLRRFLPRARNWFITTSAGLLLSGLAARAVLAWISTETWNPVLTFAAWLLPVGFALGLVQWLYLRRFLPNAYWIIAIDVLATSSFLLAGQSITSLIELVMILVLPGVITGIGLWLLLSQLRIEGIPQRRVEVVRKKGRRLPRIAWIGLGLAALVPLFFGSIWVLTASQLALAKNEGIYRTPEEAVIAVNSQGWGGAKVDRIEGVRAGQNSAYAQPEVWFGTATVYLDRIPQGWTKSQYLAGSYFIHVRDGWVFMPESAFPEFIGWVMELYGMEGAHR